MIPRRPVPVRRLLAGLARCACVAAFAGVSVLVFAAASAGDDSAPHPSNAAGSGSGLAGPSVVKLDWNTRALRTADLDGDGTREIVLVNNDRARIEILDEEAWREDGAQTTGGNPSDAGRTRVTTAARAYDLAVGDIDGDGRPDLLYTADPGGLVVRLQLEDGSFGEAVREPRVDPVGWPGSIALLPRLDGPGRDVALVSKNGMRTYALRDGGWVERARLPLDDGDPFGLRVRDFDGDGRPDLLYCMTDSAEPLRLRFRRADGGLGPERAVKLDSHIGPVEPLENGPGGPRLAWLEASSHAFRTARLVSETVEHEPTRERYRAPVADVATGAWTRGDLDGDGRDEWYVADADGARVWRYAPMDDGALDAPVAYPAFSGVRALAVGDVDGNGTPALLMSSSRERTIGVARWSEGRLTYPEPIPVDGRPDAMTAADLDGDGRADVAYARQSNGDREVVPVFSRGDGWTAGDAVTLDDLKTNVDALVARDLDGDGRSEVLAFAPKNPVRLVEFTRDGAKEIRASNGEDRSGLVDGLRPAELTFADLDGDGNVEWLAAGEGRVRLLNWSREHGFRVQDQLNASNKEDVRASFPAPARSGVGSDVWLAVGGDGTWERLARDDDGVWRPAERRDGAPVEPRAVFLEPDGAWIAGRRALERIRLGGRQWVLKPGPAFEQDLEDVRPVKFALGDWNGDDVPEAALVDALESRVLQVVGADGDRWRRHMHFRVFEEDPSYTGPRGSNREPRELEWSDLDGDGRRELVLLVHDRVLVYRATDAAGAADAPGARANADAATETDTE